MAKNQEKELDINDEYQQRLAKLDNLREAKIDPYPAQSNKTTDVADFLKDFDKLLASQKKIIIGGRITSLRLQGGSCFFHFQDYSGKVQIFFRKDQIGAEDYKIFKENIDTGDFIEVAGTAFETKTKEPTLLATSWQVLSKALLSLPDEYYGLKDPDLRFRKRYLDLLVNPKVKDTFKLRSDVIKLTRQYFDKEGFIEVDTPVLQSVAGGATAEPFITHHNALDIDMYLRVAPELYLKRLIVGGYDQVYEMARCFRNEGIDHQHNPEFTQIEAYWAYKEYSFLMEWMEKYFEFLVKGINNGDTKIKNAKDIIDFKGPYPRLDFKEALDKALKIDLDKTSDKELVDIAKQAKLDVDKTWGRGKLLDELYKKFVRSKLIQPTFIINHPLELSPLSKKMPDRPGYVERFQLVVKTAELCNAFSELNDPLDQEERFAEQKKLHEAGDQEAQGSDAEFVEALKHGMPPTVGLGVGIDRLVMMLGDIENIKEVILFPTMRPKNNENK
ncbi:MAG: lysine--tRNA ligase [Candidatus Komeilibacteria bacterium]|jgi:lysyl-tRNA synthetase, class II|nr:lysine--tRNA ligase [Candidatus Komeilibacteria bacterium]MBT4447646.1 lysine--tRNA ligase [Candidatus Komeilibacteria bacterium]